METPKAEIIYSIGPAIETGREMIALNVHEADTGRIHSVLMTRIGCQRMIKSLQLAVKNLPKD